MFGAAHEDTEYTGTVLDCLAAILSEAGWVDLDRSTWEGGMEQSLLRRGEHCLTAAYDPVTHQVRLVDGKPELECMLQLLADDGILTGHNGQETIDAGDEATQRWGGDLLTAATTSSADASPNCPN